MINQIFFKEKKILTDWRIFLLSFFLLLPVLLLAQETVVTGQIINKTDGMPLPGVNISFRNSSITTRSDKDGYFLIQSSGNYNTLVFSCVGFKQTQLKLKPGQSLGTEVQMEEDNLVLQEVFVIPGTNPALEMIKKIRLMAKENDVSSHTNFVTKTTEQTTVLLDKIDRQTTNKRIFEQLKKGNLSENDSLLSVPLYMVENQYEIIGKVKNQVSHNVFSSPETGERALEKLVGDLSTDLNFYKNSVTVMGKNIISPLAAGGSSFYSYYLSDSTRSAGTKQYKIKFISRNKKNLALDGTLWVDSASMSLIKVEAELPEKANINFIHHLRINRQWAFSSPGVYLPQSEEMSMGLDYSLLNDSSQYQSGLFVKRKMTYSYNDSILKFSEGFAGTKYNIETLDEKLKDLDNTPTLRAAKWIADALLTGYAKVGKIDIGKLQQLLRFTQIEGLRVNFPFRTNEDLWKNISLGGYAGYGFRNQTVKYSADAQFRLPSRKKWTIGMNYTNDYRHVDYKYYDLLYRENPLISGDEDISSTIFSFREGINNTERHELSVNFRNDWTKGIETYTELRRNQYLANDAMPMKLNGQPVAANLNTQSVFFSTRFSFNEQKYDDHLQRIYMYNRKPVIYGMCEAGTYQLGNNSGKYGKLMAMVRHEFPINQADLYYTAEAGMIFGNVPYPLLQTPSGGKTEYMMNDMEYVADKFVNLHTELTLNGLVTNWIPIVKVLNLREIFNFNFMYGTCSEKHKNILDLPSSTYLLNKPYMEVGAGFCNILHVFVLESVWRLSDLQHPNVKPWGLRVRLKIDF